MLLNFALEAVGTKVLCSKISTDGYECKNLINSDFRHRRKGFLAEHFIKPPVDVSFHLPCNVHIFCILCDPFVGRQQSSQLEVYCASKPMPRTKHGKRRAEETQQSNCIQDDSTLMFFPVAKISSPDHTRVCFFNPRFSARVFDQYNHLLSTIQSHAKAEMRHMKSELLMSATHLKVRISRIQNGSTPALSNIEIWGSISSHVSNALQISIQDKYQAFLKPDCTSSPKEPTLLVTTSTTEKEKKLLSDDVYIPEEFIDPLTCEIMTIPILLPSGKNVDKYSLDQYFDSEASYGRQPRDPFTGMEFSGNIKPVPNGPLKVRIDHFLATNSTKSSLVSAPRTVSSMAEKSSLGKRKHISTLNISHLIKNERNLPSTSKSQDVKNLHENSEFKQSKQPDYSFLCSQKSFKMSDNKSDNETDTKTRKLKVTEEKIGTSPTSASNVDNKSHDCQLKDSLDSALLHLLGSSTGNQEKEILESKLALCTKCQKNLRGDVGIYAFPCSHGLCGPCLSHSEKSERGIFCIKCEKYFSKSDIVRAHTSSCSF